MSLSELPIFIVDAFTDVPFEGNPAAVCLVEDEKLLPDERMQQIASEMNLSETVYIIDTKKTGFTAGDSFRIRWFTPTNEVPLCGHATVASATILFYHVHNKCSSITFDSASGPLITERAPPKGITMNFPLNPPEILGEGELSDLLKLTVPEFEWFHSAYLCKKTMNFMVRLQDRLNRSDLESLKLDTTAMLKAEPTGIVRGVIITLIGTAENGCVDKAGEPYDFISRYFAPWNGIPEDPVTGSAHTVSGAYWSTVLQKRSLYARQCSKRGGDVRIEIKDNGRVNLTGQSTIVMKGSFMLQ